MAYFQPNIYGAVFPPQLASMPSYPTAGGGWGMGAQGGTTTTTTAPGAPSPGGMDQLASLGLGLAARRYGPGLLSMGRNVWNDYFGPPQPLPTYTGPTPWMLPEPAIGDPGFSAAAAEIPMGGMEGFTGAAGAGDFMAGGIPMGGMEGYGAGMGSLSNMGGGLAEAGASGAGTAGGELGMTGTLLADAGTEAAAGSSAASGAGSFGGSLASAGLGALGSMGGAYTAREMGFGGSGVGTTLGGAAGSIIGGMYGGPAGAAGGGYTGAFAGGLKEYGLTEDPERAIPLELLGLGPINDLWTFLSR